MVLKKLPPMTTDRISLVKEQYSTWPFPKPIADIEQWKANGGDQYFDMRLDHATLWPEKPYDPELSVLVAGCGTAEAAIDAYNNPAARVVGIDLSPASLEHTARLQQKHGLANLELREMDLRDAAALNRKFDLIVAFGVLHHLPNPQEGLDAFSKILRDDGVLLLSVYGKYQREGAKRVQEAVRRMTLTLRPSDVDFACEIFSALPPWHPALFFVPDIQKPDPASIVDTFMHAQETAFSVPEIMDFVRASDFQFQGWFDNLWYYPEALIDHDHPLYKRICTLPECEQWAVVELLTSPLFKHVFMLRKKTCSPAKFRIDLSGPDWQKLIPVRQRHLSVEEHKGVLKLKREQTHLELTGFEKRLLTGIDGMMPISAILDKASSGVWGAESKAKEFFTSMYRMGHLVYKHGA